MPEFFIRYGLGGGFGGCERQDWEKIECETEDEADLVAYDLACEEYDGMAGLQGLRTVEEIVEQDEVDEEEAEQVYEEEREGWIDYQVSAVYPDDYNEESE